LNLADRRHVEVEVDRRRQHFVEDLAEVKAARPCFHVHLQLDLHHDQAGAGERQAEQREDLVVELGLLALRRLVRPVLEDPLALVLEVRVHGYGDQEGSLEQEAAHVSEDLLVDGERHSLLLFVVIVLLVQLALFLTFSDSFEQLLPLVFG